MTEKMTVWTNAQETMTAFTPFYQQVAVDGIREAGALDSWFVLLHAAAVDPAPLTNQRLSEVSPYVAPPALTERIDKGIEGGFLSGSEASGYLLTDKGRAALAAFFNTAHALIEKTPVLSAAEMESAAVYLGRIAAATEQLTAPAEKPNLSGSRWTDPGVDAPATVRIDQSITDLLAFRDDAHVATWQATGVDGRTWEAFTFVWREDAQTAAELIEKLPRRGYTEQDYAESLAALGERSWLEETAGNWRITDPGRVVREAAEAETNSLFFASWNTLDETELQDLDDLLNRLQTHLKEAAPVAEPA